MSTNQVERDTFEDDEFVDGAVYEQRPAKYECEDPIQDKKEID